MSGSQCRCGRSGEEKNAYSYRKSKPYFPEHSHYIGWAIAGPLLTFKRSQLILQLNVLLEWSYNKFTCRHAKYPYPWMSCQLDSHADSLRSETSIRCIRTVEQRNDVMTRGMGNIRQNEQYMVTCYNYRDCKAVVTLLNGTVLRAQSAEMSESFQNFT
jgi:hypothetical protein